MVSILNWPTLSPDLSPIENTWNILTCAVYQNGKQYSSIKDLKSAIENA